MKRNKLTTARRAATLAGVLGLALSLAPAAHAAPTQTGQGIMVNLNSGGDTFTVVNNIQYRYNETTAAGYFANAVSGGPTVTCGGSPANCDPSNQPATPAAPAPDALQVTAEGQSAVQDNQCVFLTGGTLTGRNYTQQVTKPGLNTKGNWTFTWNYAVTPTTNPVAAFTAWDIVHQGVSDAQVDLNADIAGESVLAKSGGYKKFSFSLEETDPVTLLPVSRVQNLSVSVNGTPVATPGSTLLKGVDFAYTTNAGSNGVTSLLVNGDARTILNTDSFAGNQDGGADGSALAKAVMSTVTLQLGPGDYNVALTGTVKGNSASASIPFTVTTAVHIIAPGCGASFA